MASVESRITYVIVYYLVVDLGVGHTLRWSVPCHSLAGVLGRLSLVDCVQRISYQRVPLIHTLMITQCNRTILAKTIF